MVTAHRLQEIRIDLLFQPAEAGGKEYAGETVSISERAFVMRSPVPLKLESLLTLRMRVPVEISGSPFGEMRGSGRVISECRLRDGTIGYQVVLD